jgi:hypothetical protein
MKKVVAASLLAVSSVFAYTDVYQFLGKLDTTLDGRPILGDIVGYNEDVIGKFSCSNKGEYQVELIILNLNVGYKDVLTKKLDNKRGNEVCKALGRKDPDIEVYSSTYINGAKYNIDSDGYNNSEATNKYGLPGCKLLHSAAIDANGGKHDFVWRSCYTVDIANASIKPVPVDYDSKESVYTYARKLMDSAHAWNDTHINKYSGLWIDMKEQRDRYPGNKILEIAADANYLGDYVDGKGNYLFSIKPSQSDEPFIALAGKEYVIDFKLNHKEELVSAIRAYYLANRTPDKTTYVYECHPSTKVDGVQSSSLGFIVQKIYDVETYRYAALNPYDKNNKYSCQKDIDGTVMDPTAAAGILLFTNATFVPPLVTQK